MALPKPARSPPPRSTPTNGAAPAPDPWAGAPSDRLPNRFDPVHHHAAETPATFDSRPVRTGQALVGVMVLGAIGYAIGWMVSYYGWLPGVFRASDIGLPMLMFATLRGVGKITERGLSHPVHAKAAIGIGRAGRWAIIVYWLGTLTNVLQLGIGLALGIITFQGYATRNRLAKAGFSGFGPAFVPMLAAVGTYILYQLLRIPLGPVPGFDAMSAAGSFVAAIAIIRVAKARVEQSAHERPSHDAAARASAGATERRVLVALIVGYLFFRVFVSGVIPYGPIVEWFLVCIGVLFFAIIAADRIGTVPTRRSLPAPDKRTHVQRVSSLPDRQLAATQDHLTRFIERGQDVEWMHDHFARLLRDAGHSDAEVAALVAPLVRPQDRRGRAHAPAEAMGIEARGRLVHDLVAALRSRRVPTGTLKADPRVQTPARRRAAAGA